MIKFHNFRGDQFLVLDGNEIISGTAEYVLDDTSSSSITFATQGCRNELKNLKEFSCWMTFEKNNFSWSGPIIDIEDDSDSWSILAQDASVFLKRCEMSEAELMNIDAADAAEYLFSIPFVEGAIKFTKFISGISVDVIHLEGYITVRDALDNIADSGIDWFVVGTSVKIFPSNGGGRIIELSDDNFESPPVVKRAGASFADRVIVNAKEQAVADSGQGERYGVGSFLKKPITKIYTESSISNLKSAQSFANTQLAASANPLYVNVGSEIPLRNCDISGFYPGDIVNVSLNSYCLPAEGSFKVQKVKYDLKTDKVSLSLIPMFEVAEGSL